MRESDMVKWVRREVTALLRLSPWIAVSLLVAVALWHTDLGATSGLFQSPPTATATAKPATPIPTQTVAPVLTSTPAEPTEAPEPTASSTEIPETPTTAPVEPTEVPVEPPTEAPPPATPLPSPTEQEPEPKPSATEESQRYADEDSNVQFEWGELFDSLALGASYLWLCCGVFVVLSIPVLFTVLWVASRRRQQREEE